MSILNQEEELKVFPCPSCKKLNRSTAEKCKFCDLLISDEVKRTLIEKEEERNRSEDVEFHRNIFLIGIAILFVGAGMLSVGIVNIYAGTGGFFIWSPIVTVFGFGQTIYGLLGIRKAKRR